MLKIPRLVETISLLKVELLNSICRIYIRIFLNRLWTQMPSEPIEQKIIDQIFIIATDRARLPDIH